MKKNKIGLLKGITIGSFAIGFVLGRFILTGTFGWILGLILIGLCLYCWISCEWLRLGEIDDSRVNY